MGGAFAELTKEERILNARHALRLRNISLGDIGKTS
ncbi:MAG: hypothetical protein JWP25_8472 [Bradyrhizobium sp.]|jgi:hypothetical protein|nr:hypothetical protein [Bradyrhizobium sp.]